MKDARVFGERMTMPEFKIVSSPVIKIRGIRLRRFKIISGVITPENFWSEYFETNYDEIYSMQPAILPNN